MFNKLILLSFIIFKAATSDIGSENPVIRLFYGNDGNKNYTVWKDIPLTIFIEAAYPLHVWCRSKYYTQNNVPDFIPTTQFNNDIVAKLSVENVTAEMSTKWACTVLKNYVSPGPKYLYKKSYYTAKDLLFSLHVRGAKAVILSANSYSLTYATTDLSVNYDGETSYTYVEGEDLEISCKKDLDDSTTLRLEYYNAAGILLFKTGYRKNKPHLFRAVLKSYNNNYYLECILCTTEFPHREYRYRTTFMKKKVDLQVGADQPVILSVNGQELTTMFHKYSSYNDYIFRFSKKGDLNVACRKKDNTVRGAVGFYSVEKKFSSLVTRRIESEAVISVNITTSNLDKKTLICHIISNTKVLQPNASILFLSDVLQNDIRIQGLPRNNVLYKYTNDENRWTNEYQYSVNETLNLTCVSYVASQYELRDASFFEWKFQGKSYESLADYLPTHTSIKWSQKPFVMNLDETHNTTKLLCIYFPYGKQINYNNESVEVIFRLKPDLVAEANDKETSTSGESSTNNDVLIYSLSSALAIVVCSIVVIIIILYKRPSTQELTLPTSVPDPASRYYENMLSVFAPMNAREAEALENHYEEIQ